MYMYVCNSCAVTVRTRSVGGAYWRSIFALWVCVCVTVSLTKKRMGTYIFRVKVIISNLSFKKIMKQFH